METIQKIQKVRAHDREVRRQYELQQRPKLIPFRKYRLQKRLGETTSMSGDIQDSILATLPVNAGPADVDYVAQAIRNMNQVGPVVVVAVLVAADN